MHPLGGIVPEANRADSCGGFTLDNAPLRYIYDRFIRAGFVSNDEAHKRPVRRPGRQRSDDHEGEYDFGSI